LSVQLPRAWLGRWLRAVDDPAPRVAPRDHGWGRVLSALCLELGQAPGLATACPDALLTDHVGALLAASLEPTRIAPATSGVRGLVERATGLLQQYLNEQGLTAERVATELGVSARTLHRAFTANGASFAATLQRLRLEQAREWLMQPRLAALTVAEIGRRCGFADASHFVRAFHRRFGQTPWRWRRDERRI
jgi:AraC-like DNA-binding protein